MHARWCLTIFVLLVADTLAAGQNTGAKLNGIVIVNEKGGPPLGNISLSAGDDASPTASDPEKGTFTFFFPKKRPGQAVHIYVKAEGYSVVNDVQLQMNLPDDPDLESSTLPIIICKCKTAALQEMRSRFYLRMSIQEIEARYAQRIKDLEERHSADAETIARLSKERDQAIALATRTADEFAKQDINKVSNIYRQAMQLFLAGKVQDAIQLLDEDKLSRQLKAANEQEAAAKATREQVAQEWMLKGSLLTLQFRFWEADHAYKNAIGSSPGDTDATRAYAVFEENEKVNEAQTENVFKCPSPCGPHGPYPDAPIDGIPRDLPNARAWTGSSIALARQLSDLIEEGNLLVRQCLWNANIEFLGEKEIEWQAKVEQLLSPSLDPRLIEALSKVNPKQLSRTNDHNQHGIALCNSTEAETDLLTMYFNQLLGVGD